MSISLTTPTEAQIGEIEKIASRLLKGPALSVERIGGGRNSCVYRVVGPDSHRYALKAYFRHDLDRRDRLQTEFSSLTWLWENGIKVIPKPIAADRDNGCAIYEYLEGSRIEPHEISDSDIDEAVLFLAGLKKLTGRPGSNGLADAADACFSVEAIVEQIEERLNRFVDKDDAAGADEELCRWLAGYLKPQMEEIIGWCRTSLDRAGISYSRLLEAGKRTLSPSDFGFHNSLRQADGRLVFVDFEYFGWDDPAKMTVDMLLHPAMKLGDDQKKRFVAGLLSVFNDQSDLAKRIEIVYPLWGIKWCLILLNEFLPEHLLRRRFADTDGFPTKVLQAKQFSKVKSLLQKIGEEYERFPYFP